MRTPRWLNLKELRRWLTLRCEHCGHRFRWKRDSRFSFGNRDGNVYHEPCMGYIVWRWRAEERLEVLGVTADLAQLTGRDVCTVMEMRPDDAAARSAAHDLAWRVFFDLDRVRSGRVR